MAIMLGAVVGGPFGSSTAKAQLGQTRSQCDAHFGSPIIERDPNGKIIERDSNGKIAVYDLGFKLEAQGRDVVDLTGKTGTNGFKCIYRSDKIYPSDNDLWIEIEYAGTNNSAICWLISYFRWQNPKSVEEINGNEPLSGEEVNTFLQSNAEGHHWIKSVLNLRGQDVASNNTFAVLPVGSVIYSNATIRRVTPATATIFHSTGVMTVPLENLSPELQTQFGYKKERADSFKDLELVKDDISDYWIRDDYAQAIRDKGGGLHIANYKNRRSD
jgi:hypothetical protein